METILLREAIFPPKIADGPGVVCGSLVGVLLLELPSVERMPTLLVWGDVIGVADNDVGDDAGRVAAAVGEADEREAAADGLDFPPPPPPLLDDNPPKRASRLEAWSRL